ncbi:MAG TPA: cobalamin-binding protein [Actinomycetota bacterium]|nr:cobalamin-binding protein [Actinomycetota bacterium]
MRVVSLLPSATEIVYALGAQDDLVGVSCDCDHPAVVADKPVVSRTALEISSGSSPGDVDRMVRERLETADSIYSVDRELVQRLRPDVILAQDLCRVCAVPSGDVEEALSALGCTAEVVSLDPRTLDDVIDSIATVGAALGVPERAAAVVAGLRARLDRVRDAVRGKPRPRVVVLEWADPPFAGGHWIPDMVEIAGGCDVLAEPGQTSRTVTWAEIAEAAPDALVYAPCGYDLDEARAQLPALLEVDAFRNLPPVRSGAVCAVDSSAYFSRPGPRLVDGVEILAGLLHPS